MANPRRTSYAYPPQFRISHLDPTFTSTPAINSFISQTLISLKSFLSRRIAFPLLFSIFLFLTWAFLKIQQSAHFYSSSPPLGHQERGSGVTITDDDHSANLARFSSSDFPSLIVKDKRGWLVDPLSVAIAAGISGGAVTCASIHVGEIRHGGVRGNHRHYNCNETFLIWGARTMFRLENNTVDKGYAEVTVAADEVAVAGSPSGMAHALRNVDPAHTTFFLGCQDRIVNYNGSSDYNVWKDL